MNDLLEYLLKSIIDHPDDLSISEERDEELVRYNIHLNDQDYPKVIGKRGLTIKAIQEMLQIYSRKTAPDDFTRIYLNVTSEETGQD
ncbi:MAG: KH domain-containing protein [Candidatus Paceibacterota bacterium]